MRKVTVTQVRDVLAKVSLDDVATVADDESLFEAGVLDSLMMIELVQELENRFGTIISNRDLTPSNFDTLIGMSEFVSRRLADGTPCDQQ